MTLRRFAFLLACLLPVSMNTPAFSACQADDTATATEVTKLNWAALQVPGGSTTYTIAANGGADSGTGTKLYDTTARGQYNIVRDNTEGASGCTITIDIVNVAPGDPNLMITGWTGRYNGSNLSGNPPWTGRPRPVGGKTLYLGATATYNGSIPVGTLTPSFDIRVTYAANATGSKDSAQTASIKFDNAITIDTVMDINFGMVKALTAGNFTINTAGVVTPGGGGEWLYGTTSAGSMVIRGSSTQTIAISTGSYISGGIGGGVTLSNATCSYNGGAEVACSLSGQAAPTSAGKTLLLGVTATVNASQTAGSSATPSFTVTVVYT